MLNTHHLPYDFRSNPCIFSSDPVGTTNRRLAQSQPIDRGLRDPEKIQIEAWLKRPGNQFSSKINSSISLDLIVDRVNEAFGIESFELNQTKSSMYPRSVCVYLFYHFRSDTKRDVFCERLNIKKRNHKVLIDSVERCRRWLYRKHTGGFLTPKQKNAIAVLCDLHSEFMAQVEVDQCPPDA